MTDNDHRVMQLIYDIGMKNLLESMINFVKDDDEEYISNLRNGLISVLNEYESRHKYEDLDDDSL